MSVTPPPVSPKRRPRSASLPGCSSGRSCGTDVVEIGDYIYRDTLLDAVVAPAVTRYLAEELNWKKVALVTTTGLSYSEGLTNIFKPALADYGIDRG